MAKNKIKFCNASRFLLKITFFWPFGDELNGSLIFRISAFATIFLLTTTTLILSYMYSYFTFKEKDKAVTESLGISVSYTGIITISVLFVLNRKKIAEILIYLSDFHKFGQPKNFIETNQLLNKISWILNIYGWTTCVVYTIWRIYQIPECRKEKIRYFCGVPPPIYAPFDYTSYQILIICYYFILLQVLARSLVLVPFVLIEIVVNIKLRLDHLNELILKALEHISSETEKKIYNCILYHNDIIKTCGELNKAFNQAMFAYLVAAGVTCGCLENQLIQNSDFVTAFHLVLWLSAVLVASFAGQTLIDASTSTAETVYNSKWYNANVKLKKILLMILMRAQKPELIRTGAFNNLRFSLFVWIIRTSYSFYAVLKQ